jgi:integrase
MKMKIKAKKAPKPPKKVAPQVAKNPRFKKMSVPGLFIYVRTGGYYAYFKAQGKVIRLSLNTSVRSIAEEKLRDVKKTYRGTSPDLLKPGQKMTFGDALAIYRDQVATDVKNKGSSKHYREQTITALLKSWPELETTDIRKISEKACRDWASKFSKRYSATRYNNTLGTLRSVIGIALNVSYISRNPALAPGKRRVLIPPLTLPSASEFQAFIEAMRNGRGRYSNHAADLAEFLAYSGCRKEEAARAQWCHLNLQKNELTIVGDPITGTKNWRYRTNPLNPDLRALLLRMMKDRGGNAAPESPICAVSECQHTMDRAAKVIGIHRLTHHNLRDLFATTCIESGTDVPTVAKWLGHSDGGTTCMQRYVNPRIGPGKEAAAKVSFGRKNAPAEVNGSDHPAT